MEGEVVDGITQSAKSQKNKYEQIGHYGVHEYNSKSIDGKEQS